MGVDSGAVLTSEGSVRAGSGAGSLVVSGIWVG